ncbi:threonine--tRNA ligase, partial [Patescibacteria group bacterium]|nr:threonine--tRNA ligase [Patescibacteria group bacterium]
MENKLDILRHSTAHVLATAVLEMFPEAKFGIGPNIEDGFYYDFDLPRTLIPEDLPLLEEKMRAIIKTNYPFEKSEIDAKKAVKLFKEANQPYKVELIKDLQASTCTSPEASARQASSVNNSSLSEAPAESKGTVSIYKTGGFVDLCRGPHLDSTGEIKADAFKLTKIAGAYWRGDEKNKMLQRIYGTAWESKKDLDAYLSKIEEAAKRDHRKIGKDQDLFSFHDVAPGMPFFHPKGNVIYNELKKFWMESQKEFRYEYVLCPSMLDVSIWKQSGHWDHYKEDMYFIKADKDEKEYALRPMDCPGAILIYNNSLRSYRELPLRYAEPGLITRKEKSGQLNGLFRVQQFVQDDAHIFLTENQIEEEIKKIIALVDKIYRPFGLKYKAFLSTRPDDFMGDKKSWDKAETALKKILDEVYGAAGYGLKEKDGAFYGPKIDYELEDAIGRTWQCATIQLDFQMPGKFGCRYIDDKGKEQIPVLIHRTIMGAFERFMGILIEHYAGAFPVWLA